MRVTAVFLVALLATAGCVAPDEEIQPTETDEPEIILDEDRPTVSYGDVVTGPAVGPDLNATTAAAPRLVEGEWWRIRYESNFDNGLTEVIRVVADVNEDGYIVGMPHEGWLKEAISFHAPGFGDINPDLSYNTHNERFQPVRFPLVVGDTWETSFATSPLIATVTEADDFTATIVLSTPEDTSTEGTLFALLGMTGENTDTIVTYDARQHEIVRMESPLGVWEVVEHGYDFEGWVTVPRGEDTAIDYGVLGPISDSHTPLPQELTVEGGFNRMTMMHLAITLTDAPAHVTIRDVDPEGTEMLTEFQGAGMALQFFESNQPDGTWTSENVVAGAAVAYHMGIAYHQYDIRLPDGARRTDHSHPVIR